MSKLKTLFTLALVLAFSLTATVPAFAHGDEDDGVGDSATEAKERVNKLKEQYKKQAQEKVEVAKEKTQEKTAEARQQACTARKGAMQKRLSLKVTLAEKHKTAFDKIFSRVENFYNQKNLEVANYEALLEATEDAQADATAKLDALKAININIDCSEPTVADTVSTFREALSATRDSLKTYKTSLKELIKAVHQAAQDQGSNNE